VTLAAPTLVCDTCRDCGAILLVHGLVQEPTVTEMAEKVALHECRPAIDRSPRIPRPGHEHCQRGDDGRPLRVCCEPLT